MDQPALPVDHIPLHVPVFSMRTAPRNSHQAPQYSSAPDRTQPPRSQQPEGPLAHSLSRFSPATVTAQQL